MVRRFNKKLLTEWLNKNGPMAKEKLAVKAEVSFSFVQSLLRNDRLPRSGGLMAIAAAMEVDPKDLVVEAPARGKKTA